MAESEAKAICKAPKEQRPKMSRVRPDSLFSPECVRALRVRAKSGSTGSGPQTGIAQAESSGALCLCLPVTGSARTTSFCRPSGDSTRREASLGSQSPSGPL